MMPDYANPFVFPGSRKEMQSLEFSIVEIRNTHMKDW